MGLIMKSYRDQDWVSPKVEIRPSAIHGKGMFAIAVFAQDEVVAVWGGRFVSRGAAEQVGLAGKAIQQIDEDVFEVFDRDQPGPTYYHNHSCEPNTGMGDEVTVGSHRVIGARHQPYKRVTSRGLPLAQALSHVVPCLHE
jgi:hypothetical protein